MKKNRSRATQPRSKRKPPSADLTCAIDNANAKCRRVQMVAQLLSHFRGSEYLEPRSVANLGEFLEAEVGELQSFIAEMENAIHR